MRHLKPQIAHLQLGVGVSSQKTSLLLSKGGAEGPWSLAALKTQNVLEPAETHNLPKKLEPVMPRRSLAVIYVAIPEPAGLTPRITLTPET